MLSEGVPPPDAPRGIGRYRRLGTEGSDKAPVLQLSSCEVGVRLHVEVPVQSFELSLAEVHSLRANLPTREKKSRMYARMHGTNVRECTRGLMA
jgi:hypothetical protein